MNLTAPAMFPHPLIGVGVSAWDRLGIEEHVPNYRIVCGENRPWLKLLPQSLRVDTVDARSTAAVLETPRFQRLVATYDTPPYLLVYKNTARINAVADQLGLPLLAADYTVSSRLENKVEFRQLFGTTVRVPPYTLTTTSDLDSSPAGFQRWQQQYGSLVIQDEYLSSGRGTYIVHDYPAYQSACTQLTQAASKRIVVSQFIHGEVASLQGCITRYGTLATPLQRQIVANPILTAVQVPQAEKFSGGEWGYTTYPASTAPAAEQLMQTLGTRLYSLGFRGIFGVDVIVAANGELFVLEINARLTGLSGMIAQLQHLVSPWSLLLLHLHELANQPYPIDHAKLSAVMPMYAPASYLILHNTRGTAVRVDSELRSGIYHCDGNTLTFKRPGYSFEHVKADNEMLLADVPDTHEQLLPGKRMLRVLTRQPVVGKTQQLLPDWQEMVALITEHFVPA